MTPMTRTDGNITPKLQTPKTKVVMIYEDPLTELIPEGQAVLLEKQSENGELEGWKVSFENDDSVVFRWVKKK